jgi:beta-phosphoglucomutase
VGVHPYNCLVFEDAESGVQAALAAGMKCIGIGDSKNLPSAQQTITDYAEIDIEAMIETGKKSRIDSSLP